MNNSEMLTEVKYQTKFILNTLPLVEGIMVDYHTRKKISPETNVEDDNICEERTMLNAHLKSRSWLGTGKNMW
jgi:hypothetical protein